MKLGGRISAAVEVLADIETRHRPVSEALKDWGVSHRFAGSGDRAVIGNIVYDALRWRSSSAWTMGQETPRAVVLATIARRWDVGIAGLTRGLLEDPHGPQPLTEDETARLKDADLTTAPAHIRADVPEWAAEQFERAFGDSWVEEAAGLAARPPLDVRANTLKADRAKILKALASFDPSEAPFAPDGLRIAATKGEGRHPNVESEGAFQRGWFEVQDEGSQLAAAAVAAPVSGQVLDLCAGAGGKTLAIAAALGNRGQIFATDRDRTRLAPIYARLKRAGTRNVQVRGARAPLDDLVGRMAVVLVDAPCTGSGTWRRRPDSKWRLSERALADRVAEQQALLPDSARYVAPGGRLVYVTCSLLPDENADRVTQFLAATPEFAPVPPRDVIAAAGLPPVLADAALLTGQGFTLTPRRTATDGFFVSVLRR